jgi:hypothetical protein
VKRPLHSLRQAVVSGHFAGGTEEGDEEHGTGQQICASRFEYEASRTVKGSIFLNIMPCRPFKINDVSEEHVTSILGIGE